MSSLHASNTLHILKVKYLEKLSAVKTFMKDHNLSAEIQARVINEKNISFKENEGVHTPGGQRLMYDMPIALQEDVAYFETKELFQKVPLFKDCDEAFLRRLALKTHDYIYSPGDKIITQGDKSREMYLIQKGRCEASM
ncbi:cyclic nucleotide-gated channel rod photoreceptor subunit alpha-like [Amphiura filiformis]|uniref:cyclic nucleotide-gated channel rod photoreceptor subunit alpha-like n=1 Tax=Amphiura filiformis TaxID=82378 RepID=UPI003B225627